MLKRSNETLDVILIPSEFNRPFHTNAINSENQPHHTCRVRRAYGRDTCGLPQSTTTDALVVKPLLNLSRFITSAPLLALASETATSLLFVWATAELYSASIRLPAPSRKFEQLVRVA